MRKLLLMLCLAVIATSSQAQISHGGEPISWNGKVDIEAVFERMPAFNEDALREEDGINNANKDVPYRFGNNFYIDYSLNNSGAWHTLPNGDRVWMLGIESEGAYSINFIFDEFYMPHGATLFIYNADRTQLIGSFTEENNNPDRTFSTYPVQGDQVIIEYYEPQRVAGMGELSVESITHAYRDIEAYARGLGDSGSCNNNVICPVSAGWENEINSVAMIVVNGNGICTGALVNNTANDGHPYFLTANHCTGGGVTNWVFRFNWQSPSCAANQTSAFDTVSGSQLLASGASADYCLLRINNGNPIPTAYNPYYAGWDASGAGPSSQVAIHHPSGDIKKISFDNNAAGTATYNGATCWRIFTWEDGTTEPGSSGSPLFDQNHRIIGQLYGGQATCSNNVNDYYGKFDVTFPNVCQWLAPGCGTTVINGYDPNAPTAALDAQLQSITDPSGTICGSTVTPVVTIRNAGTTTITSLTINSNVDGGANQAYAWTGSLASGASANVTLPAISPANGAHTFNASVANPNGGTDQNAANNSANSAFTITSGGSIVTFSFSTDCWGEETSWDLSVQGGSSIQSVGVNTLADLTTFDYEFCLADGCYDLTISDSFGDGVEGSLYSCGIDGDYSVIQDGGTVLVQMATPAFGTGIVESFCVAGTAITGCTNPAACNYNSAATVDDGSCLFSPAGDVCSDAINIAVDGGPVAGNNSTACANGPDPSCGGVGIIDLWYSFDYTGGNITLTTTLGTLGDTRLAVFDGCGGTQLACNDDVVQGDLSSFISLSCAQLNIGSTYLIQVGGYQSLTGAFTLNVTSTDTEGCTNPAACNYEVAAICDDGSCILPNGCTNPAACNYNAGATCDDGSCILPNGCTNPAACNYNAGATCDDGSCILPNGCTNPAACNYNAGATCDDGSCILPDGCTNPIACNYNNAALCDDGSCTFGSTWYEDNDNDGYGSAVSTISCSQPVGFVAITGDCDDIDPTSYPGAPATASGVDNDCNGNIDPDEQVPSCMGDFNNDLTRNVADLLILLSDIGCSGTCDSDLNTDNVVNSGDVVSFLSLFGTDCP